ncbi:BREX system serine/threonine kinase PglW [Micromonospora sp. NPDC049559]|uniref:BREX system serine/threonine kinase PglW n=1 Tax=Micromonospora sp. NPDC049559 TaxID=3155923 RepID=UPI00343213EC
MREDSPRWEQINPSIFPHEQDGLRELASYLPDAEPYHVWANVEFVGTDGSINEVDALVLTPSGLWVLELKHWQGEISGDGQQWRRRMPSGSRWVVDSPVILANRKAKRFASVMRQYAPHGARIPYVGAAVFLHARNMQSGLDEIGRQHVYGLDAHSSSRLPSLKTMLLSRPAEQRHFVDAVRARQIVELVRGARIRPSVADRRINQLTLHQRPFAEGIGWQDFLADHAVDASLLRRVRFYLTSRAAEEDVPAIKRAAEREFRLLQGIHHPGIARALDLVEHPWGPAVVFDHREEWVRLDQWLAGRDGKLQLAQRLQLVQDLAEIVSYAHSRRLSHRSLNPRAIYVCDPEGPRPTLMVTDWQTGGRLPGTRMTQLPSATDPASLELFFDDVVRRYQAPEAATLDDLPGHQLDIFSLGALAYRIFAGKDPATTAEELVAAVAGGGLHLDAVADGMPYALVESIYDATRGDPAHRMKRVAHFLANLDLVWEELTAPEPEPVIDPLQAHRGDVLDGGLVVLGRLGSGATATALLVRRESDDDRLVLKVARDEQFADRFAAEARTVDKLRDARVAALVQGPIRVGNRTALLLESAGERTLAEDLRGGRLALDLLERYGRDLLEIVSFLDGQGVWHRDIKPANLASRPRPKDKQPHLCIFDFSLAAVPADQLTAGTTAYLDPFLGPPARLRYDAAAERFAAAVTLYEMATGTLPQWGGGANPAAVTDEVSLDPAAFDPAIADRLVAFFAKALARDVRARFDTLDEMLDAWRAVFREIPESPLVTDDTGGVAPLRRTSPLEATELTARARSALERLGILTVGELLDAEPSALTRARGVPDATRKEILARTRELRARLAAGTPEQPAAPGGATAQGIEALCATLLPPGNGRTTWQRSALRVLLGQVAGEDGHYPRWPSQGEVARLTGKLQPQVSVLLRRTIEKEWQANPALATVRNEIVALLDARGGAASSEEVAEALIAARGSYTSEPKRTAQAIGLVRAAVETELSQGGNARLAIQRLRGSDTVLIGQEPDDPTAERTAADLLGYVVRLGRRAAALAAADPLPSRQRAVEELRALEPPPAGMPPLSEARLLQLAAAGSGGEAAVNAQGQLYPAGMPAERALRLAAGALVGQELDPETVRKRIRARFPRAQELPPRPALDDLLREIPLTWHATLNRFVPPAQNSSLTGTRVASTTGPILGPDAGAQTHTRLTGLLDRRGFLVVLASIRRLVAARRALLDRLGLVEVDVTAIMLERLRGLGFPWEAIVAADNGAPADADFRSLVELVQHHVVPAVEEALAGTDRPVLITEAAPLARYQQLRLVQELADPTRARPAARLLLVAARKSEPAMLDNQQLPLTSPSQSLWLPDEWINPAPERTTPR